MSRALILSGMFALVAPSFLPAQTVRWNDRPAATWSDEAPRVRLSIDGPRSVAYGQPMRVRFEVSDDAFVAVVRVDDNGRMTILFPYSRSQRATARAGQVHFVRNPRFGGNASFVANDRMGGYIFALASFAPLDFSSFENRDYDRIGSWSRFTQANRSIARRPDVFIDRFAAAVLWDTDTPYDYDVDYYFPMGQPGMLNAYALCGSLYGGSVYDGASIPYYGFSSQWGWSDWDMVGYPYSYRSMCRDYYNRLQCYSALALYSYGSCNNWGQVIVANPPPQIPGQPVDPTKIPNEGVVRGGLFAPTPIPTGTEPESTLPAEQPAGRFDQPRAGDELDNILSIPTRATRKMKEEDARRDREANGSTAPARTGFARTDAATSKPEKGRDGSRDAVVREEPPSREPTKAKASGEPRRETVSKGGYSKGGFGSTGRTSEPRSTGIDRASRPETQSTPATASPPSIQGTTTEKKKPPTN